MLKSRGFTIVELLIVIVVIAILAAISVVAYNGIQTRANDSIVQNDLSNFGKKAELYKVENGSYPSASSSELGKLDVRFSISSYYTSAYNVYYCTNTSDQSKYALIARSKSGNAYYVSSVGSGKLANSAQSWQASCGVIGYSDLNDIMFAFGFNYSYGNWYAWTL